jgi:hypothetical protein
MDKPIDDILNSLPEKPPRSRLTPYASLIDELRRHSWTYRGIVGVLAEKCGIEVSVSNLHHFLKQRSKANGNVINQLPRVYNDASWKSARHTASRVPGATVPDNDSEFTFDPTVPLRIKES